MSEQHKLPDGVEVRVNLYLTSDSEGVDVVTSGTYRGGMRSIADLPDEWSDIAAHLGIEMGPLPSLASDWRLMTRDEVMRHKEDNEE